MESYSEKSKKHLETRSPSSYTTKPLSRRAARHEAVEDAIKAGDWPTLTALSSQPGGLEDARRVAWPFLLHVTPSSSTLNTEPSKPDPSTDDDSSSIAREPHRDRRQVELDTNRAFVHYPVESQQAKEKRKRQLTEIIMSVLDQRPQLSYFQGYHDIISTLQLTLHPSPDMDEDSLTVLRACALKITLHRTRDAMGSGLEPLTGQLRILRRLLRLADPELATLIEQATPLPYWAISPLLTLYTHDLPTLELAQRVMDWILCRPPDAVIHLVAAFTLEKKADVKRMVEEGDDGMMHSFLSNLPELDAEGLESEEDGRSEDAPAPTLGISGFSLEDETSSTIPSLTDNSSPPHSPNLESSGMITPTTPKGVYSAKLSADDLGTANIAEKAITSQFAPSPASSTSSLPPPVLSTHSFKSTVPISSILQKADKLRDRYPISHEALRLDETMGERSMLRTWSEDPRQIYGDDAAEEAVNDLSSIVLPDHDDDVFEPYSPSIEPEKTVTSLPSISSSVIIGLSFAVAMLAVTNSPTTRTQTAQAAAFVWNFVEFIWRKLRFDPLPTIDIYGQ